jgi:hypothetical protein
MAAGLVSPKQTNTQTLVVICQNNDSGAVIGSVPLQGMSAVGGTFRFVPSCGMAQPGPYEVVATAVDADCNSKTVVAIFRITVTRPTFSVQVMRRAVACQDAEVPYTAVGTASGPLRWTV